jgi:hydroxymethylpyrimidine/phosphomethylpyrimidine kinase
LSNNHHIAVPPVVLTIAGFDPSCGAGIGADLKTFAAHNVYGTAAVTALTVQSTQGARTPPWSQNLWTSGKNGAASRISCWIR